MLLAADPSQISERDLQALVEGGVPERLDIEYKRDRYGRSDDDRKELLKDVSAFANAEGGHIVIGVTTADSVAQEVTGIAGDIDPEIQWMEHLTQSSIEPRIVGLRFGAVPLANGRKALVASVPRSWNPPHRVAFKNSNRIHVRDSNGVHEASMEELRRLFLEHAALTDRLRETRAARIRVVSSNEGPVRTHPVRLILHVGSRSALQGVPQVDVVAAQEMHDAFAPLLDTGASTYRYNFDGVVRFRPLNGDFTRAYTQVFRTGMTEAVLGGIAEQLDGRPFIDSRYFATIPGDAARFANGLNELGAAFPMFVALSVEAVRDAALRVHQGAWGFEPGVPFGEAVLSPPEITFEEPPTVDIARSLMRPLFDMIWNASGFQQCSLYDSAGKWVAK